MIIKIDLNKEAQSKLIDFKNKYLDLYPGYLHDEINGKLLLGFTNNNDLINQIYCYLKLIPEKINPYLGFINILKKHFNLKENKILEVGAGAIPILAFYIYDKYKNIVNIQDPNVIFSNLIKGNIYKDKFELETDISKYDLIIGFNPCGATENIIKNAIKNHKNFAIALCGCCFLPDDYTNRTPEKWHKYLFNLAKKLGNENYEIKFKSFPKKYQRFEPVIIGIYKKSTNR